MDRCAARTEDGALSSSCICSEEQRRWTQDGGSCTACLGKVLEQQLVPVMLQILCSQGTGLVLWKNPQGFDSARTVRYGLGDGSSDYVGLYKGGRFVGVEFKTKTGRQSDAQKRWEALVIRQGGVYRIVRCALDANELLQKLKAEYD
jgi:hypothetical protein